MRVIFRLALLSALLCRPALADDQLVTFIERGGRYIELTGTRIPCWHGEDGFMAVEANDVTTSKHRPDNTGLAVYCWQRSGDNILLYRPSGKQTIPESKVRIEIIDRAPPSAPVSSSRPDHG